MTTHAPISGTFPHYGPSIYGIMITLRSQMTSQSQLLDGLTLLLVLPWDGYVLLYLARVDLSLTNE